MNIKFIFIKNEVVFKVGLLYYNRFFIIFDIKLVRNNFKKGFKILC